MRSRHRPALASTIAALLCAAPATAAVEPGVCIAVSGAEHRAVADAAQRALGLPARRVDVSRGEAVATLGTPPRERPGSSEGNLVSAGPPRARRPNAELATSCGRLIIAVGPEALGAAEASAPGSHIVPVMAESGPGGAGPGVLPGVDPRRVLETLKQIAPRVRRIGAVFDPARTGELMDEARAAARAQGVELVALPVRSVGEAVRAFHRFEGELRVDALWILPDGTATVQETVYYALELAHWRRMIVIGISPWYVASGALFALSPRPESYGAAAGELGRQVLRGTPPAGPVHAREYALYVNTRAATRLQLEIPRSLLERAEQVLP